MQEKNVNGMQLVAGDGNSPGNLQEGDQVNIVYILVSCEAAQACTYDTL